MDSNGSGTIKNDVLRALEPIFERLNIGFSIGGFLKGLGALQLSAIGLMFLAVVLVYALQRVHNSWVTLIPLIMILCSYVLVFIDRGKQTIVTIERANRGGHYTIQRIEKECETINAIRERLQSCDTSELLDAEIAIRHDRLFGKSLSERFGIVKFTGMIPILVFVFAPRGQAVHLFGNDIAAPMLYAVAVVYFLLWIRSTMAVFDERNLELAERIVRTARTEMQPDQGEVPLSA